jgi:AsmA protein
MRKWMVLGVVLAVIVGAVAVALVNLNAYLNRNKDWLAGQVTQALGRNVSFSEVGVQLFGGFGARIKDLRIADDPAFSKDDFVKAGEVQVSIRLWPALFGRYEVRRITLVRPEVIIVRTKEGFNYDSIGKKPSPKQETPGAGQTATKPSGHEQSSGEKGAFLVSLADIQKGQIRYIDRTKSTPREVRLRDLDFSASDVSLDRAVHVRLATALFGADKQDLKVEGSLGPIGSPAKVKTAALDLSIRIGPLVVDDLKKVGALAEVVPPKLSSPDPVSLDAKVSGTLDRLKLDADFDGTGAALGYGQAFQKPKSVPLKLVVDAERAGNAIDVKSLSLRIAELRLTGKGTVDTNPGGALDFQIDSQKTPLAGWDKLLPALAGHQISGNAEVHVRAQGKNGSKEPPQLFGRVALDGVSAKQSGSPYEIDALTGAIELKGTSASVPPMTFKLSGSPVSVKADVTSFRPVTATFALQSPQLSAASLNFASSAVKKAEVLRGVDVQGQFRVPDKAPPEFQGTFRSTDGNLRDFDYRDLAAEMTLRDRVATLTKLDLRAFDGTYSGGGRYDMRETENPKFDFRSKIRGMDLKGMLASQLPGSEKRIEGRVDADLALAGAGKQWETIKRQIRGDGRVDVRDGMIKDVNIADQVLASVTGIGGLSNLISPRVRSRHPGLFETGDTKFDKLGGSVQIADGVARSDDLELAARDYTILGKGTYSLDNELDFTATLLASKDLSADVIADVREAKYIADAQGRIEIPFRLTGALPHVKPKPDSEFIARALGRAMLGKGLDKLFGKEKPLPPGVSPTPDRKHPERDLLKKGLEGLFGR